MTKHVPRTIKESASVGREEVEVEFVERSHVNPISQDRHRALSTSLSSGATLTCGLPTLSDACAVGTHLDFARLEILHP